MRIFFRKCLVFSAIVVGAQVFLARCVFKNDIPEPVRAFRAGIAARASTFYFGDSTVLFYSAAEKDSRSVYEMVRDRYPEQTMARIARGGYQPEIYSRFCETMLRRGAHPKNVVVAINLRSFSSGWVMNPYYQFETESIFLKIDSALLDIFFRPLAVFRTFDLNRISQREYENAPVWDGGRLAGKIANFDNPSFKTRSDERVRQKLVFYYMSALGEDHPYLLALKRIFQTLTTDGTRVIFYITPIDHETGLRYLGPRFRERMDDNIRVIRSTLGAAGATVLDLSQAVPSADFNWESDLYPNEHMRERGRRVTADRLCEWISAGNDSGHSRGSGNPPLAEAGRGELDFRSPLSRGQASRE